MEKKKTIGILGGMGPAATVDLFNLIVENTKASCDQEHIHILIDCNPEIPDRTAAIVNGYESPLKQLCASARRLQQSGADFLAVPCSTSHFYFNDLKKEIDIPIIDMIAETAKYVKHEGFNKAIVLCTEGTRKTGVYTDRFLLEDIDVIYPNPELQKQVNDIIYAGIKSGKDCFDVSLFNRLLNKIETDTGAVTILGCTELPIAVKRYGMAGHYINPTLVLARTAIQRAGYSLS